MAARAFGPDALKASRTGAPVPRAIAFRTAAGIEALSGNAHAALDGWTVEPREPAGWFVATPPPGEDAPSLRDVWHRVRELRNAGADYAEPLFSLPMQLPRRSVKQARSHSGLVEHRFGLWGVPYDAKTARTIAERIKDADWHLDQLRSAKPGKYGPTNTLVTPGRASW